MVWTRVENERARLELTGKTEVRLDIWCESGSNRVADGQIWGCSTMREGNELRAW